MEMTLLPDRLIKIREARGLNKAEASRLLGLSKMGYLRYETCFHRPETQDFPGISCRSHRRPFSSGTVDLQRF